VGAARCDAREEVSRNWRKGGSSGQTVVSWDEKRHHYEAQDVGLLVGEVDQHVRPELVERAAAQPEVAVDLHLDVLPLLLHVRELGGLWEQHL
jgi:hypothetical protein